ncbi:MAG: DNA repair protein RadC [Verrucomicrobiae bacterium]|nr:DNA repair protein RadC [Verrucomicrobiae bacterium]
MSFIPWESMTTSMIRELPAHDRPRERLERLGAESLTDTELLAVLLRTGNRRHSALAVAHELLTNCGGMEQLSRQTVAEIAKFNGVGRVKATVLKAAFALQERIHRPTIDRCPLNHPDRVFELMNPKLASLSVEILHGLALDAKLHLIRAYPISAGLVNQTLIHAREAYRDAIAAAAAHLMIVHNHPSGDPTPSADDIRTTRQMLRAGQVLGIPLVDHLIIGRPSHQNPSGYISLKSTGIIHFGSGAEWE